MATNVIITNFESGDVISVTGAVAADYSYTSADLDGGGLANDLQITSNIDNVVGSIILLDVIGDANAFVSNEASAEAAVGFDFINFG